MKVIFYEFFLNICLYPPQYPFKRIFWCSGCDRRPPKAFICVTWWYRLLPFLFFFCGITHTLPASADRSIKYATSSAVALLKYRFVCVAFIYRKRTPEGAKSVPARLMLTLQLFLAKNRRAKCAYFQYDAVSITVKIILPRLLGFPIQFSPHSHHFSRNSNVSQKRGKWIYSQQSHLGFCCDSKR